MTPRRARAVAGGAVCVALVISGCTGASSPAPASAGPTSSAPAVSVPASDSVCGLDSVEMTGMFEQMPTDTSWEAIGASDAPTSEQMGPGLVDADGLRRCYARTPAGAVLAASNIVAMGAEPAMVRPMLERAVMPGPGQDVALAALDAQIGSTQVTVRYDLTAARLVSYDGTRALVDVGIATTDQLYLSQILTLEWSGGDWLVALTTDGQLGSAMGKVSSFAGYVPLREA